jgi:hypothetical protein
LLRRNDNSFEAFLQIGLKEVVFVACWYLLWIRRRQTQDELVPTDYHCKMSVLSITANVAKVDLAPSIQGANKWTRPEPRQVKLNVDVAFHADVGARAVGAILQDYQGGFVVA